MKVRKWGWRPDKPDHRDLVLLFERVSDVAIPKRIDLSGLMPPVYDQGDLGSCTANAIGAAMQFDRRKQSLRDYVPSRLMIYYEERRIEGTIREDAGAEIRDGLKAVATVGACDEKLWPYAVSKFKTKPPAKCYAAALDDRAVEYSRITQVSGQIEVCLSTGYPISFGFTVYESFDTDKVARTGVVPMPKKYESVLGGHAVLMVGYDRPAQQFICRNSWGPTWGKAGYFRMPYAYVCDPNLSDDFWVIRAIG